MSINAVANYFHLRRHTVKELEKRYLKQRFARILTAHIKAIGIDEIHVGNGKADSQYLTIKLKIFQLPEISSEKEV